MKVDSSQSEFKYAAFLSYSTVPDYALVRKTESFLEAFHQLPTPSSIRLRKLNICVDGSDFGLPRKSRGDENDPEEAVRQVIEERLAESKLLLVFCSQVAKRSSWVDREIKWFLEHRDADAIWLIVTEGTDPSNEPDEVFPPAVVKAGLHHKPWYDFRAFPGRDTSSCRKVRDFDEARTQLAAHLNETDAGTIQPLWYRQQRKLQRRRALAVASFFVIAFLAITASVWKLRSLPEERMNHARGELERRGFVVNRTDDPQGAAFELSIDRSPADWETASHDLSVLERYGDVTRINLDFSEVQRLEPLAGVSSVRELHLAGCRLRQLDSLRDLAHVETLVLASNPELSDDSLSSLRAMSHLTKLDLTGCRGLTDEALASLAGLPIQDLWMDSCDRITVRGLRHLRDLPLRRLRLKRTPVIVTPELVELLETGFSRLNSLALEPTHADSEALARLIRLASKREIALDVKPTKTGGF